ncbi:CD180 antigen [Rhineura floridana]|uniref:CD180 antigen n=1 Tax=Rhineura floridana TaxID=261503 RepID=UPI002AC8460D|nr:CD180 antigen [Rhineura floridana]
MAWYTYCWVLMGLLGVSCEVTKPADMMCTEFIANRSYSCEGLGLTEIPGQLPHITKVLDFSFNFLYSLQQSTFSKLKDLTYLDLTRCQVNWIYGGAFENNSQLEAIVLTGNHLLFLADTAFTGPCCLKHLDLTQTGLTSLQFIPMQDLRNLEILILKNNYIQSLALPPNFPTRNLKYLDFQMNTIQKISAEDIRVLKQVRNLTLILMDNDIMHIETRAFSSIFFYTLDFGSCVNVSVILEGLQDASTVALRLGTFLDRHVLPITPAMLQGICGISVDSVYLPYRHFLDFSADTFQCLVKIKKLDIAHTSITELPFGLAQMNILKKLNLNKNYFEHLCNIRSSAFPNLTHLYLRGNRNGLDLGSGCLESLSKLQHLDLSNSQIKSFDCCSKELRGLSSLQHLNLSYNGKLMLQNAAFNESANLKILDLTSTHILTNASQGPFCNLHFLQILNLSYSQIDLSIQHILQGLKSLIVLNLNGNSFESGAILTDNLFQQAPNLEVLTLSYCKLLAIQIKAFSALKKLRHVDLSHNNLITFISDAFSNLRDIYLNFANNRIHIIPRDMLTSLSGQSVINLSYNPLECTCSNIGLLTWYKQNIDKIEDSEETVCSKPKSLAGAKLFSINLSCGYSIAQVILITFAVITVIVVTFILILHFLKRKYQQF